MLKFLKNLKDNLTGAEIQIGIDLGTTNSVVAVMDGETPKVIESSDGQRLTPSIVAYTKAGVLVGSPAANVATLNPASTIYSGKRFIGRSWEEVKKSGAAFSVPYTVRPGYNKEDIAMAEIDGALKTFEEIASEILKKLKLDAEKFLGKSVSKAVITTPAYFNNSQREATITAGQIAGLEVVTINEPTAAALAYAYELQGSADDLSKAKKVAVYDFGGGTFDISVIEVSESEITVLGVGGLPRLGGDDFDLLIMSRVLNQFRNDTGVDLMSSPDAIARLKEAVVKCKIQLSTLPEASIVVPFIANGPAGNLNLQHTITKKEYETMIMGLVDSSIDEMRKTMDSLALKTSAIDQIILVGGSTRTPLIVEKVKKFFGRDPLQGRADEVVAIGAALYSAIQKGDLDIELYDVSSLSLGVKTIGGVMTTIIPKNTRVPCQKDDLFSTVEDMQTSAIIEIFQGESKVADENHLLGTITLEEIEPRPKGVPRIVISYALDGNGTLVVSAKDGDKEQKITLNNAKLDRKEIKKIQKEINLPKEDRIALSEQRKELSKEIKRIESEAKALPEGKKKETMIAKVEEAGRVLEEEIKGIKEMTTEIQKL